MFGLKFLVVFRVFAALSLLAFAIWWFSNVLFIGASREEAIFFYDPSYVVRIGERDGEYYPIYNDLRDGPSIMRTKDYWFFKTISRPLPPKYILEIGGKRFPLLVWLQNGPGYIYPRMIFYYIKPSLLSGRIPCLIVTLATLFGVFLFCLRFFSLKAATFSLISLSSVTSFLIVSLPGWFFQYQVLCLCSVWSSFFFFMWLNEKENEKGGGDNENLRNFLIFTLFICFGISTHLRFFGFLASIIFAALLTRIRVKVRYVHAIIFLSLVTLSSLPYIMHSIDNPYFMGVGRGWMNIAPVLEGDAYGAMKTFLLRFTDMFRSFENFINALSQSTNAFLQNFDSEEFFHQLGFYEGEFKASPLILIPLLCIFFHLDKISKLIILILLIYWIFSFVLTPPSVFTLTSVPWQFLPMVPLICILFGRSLSLLWDKMVLKLVSLMLLSSFVLPQVFQTEKIIKMTKTTPSFYSIEAQRELVNVLRSLGVRRPVNLAGLVSLEIMSEGEIRPIDYFYFVALNSERFEEIINAILKINRGGYMILSGFPSTSLISQAASKIGIGVREVASIPKHQPAFTVLKLE